MSESNTNIRSKQFKHELRQRILSKSKKKKREEGKSPFLKGC